MLIVVFTLAYVLGQNKQTKTQKNMQGRLDLTRQRYQNCENERRSYTGKRRSKEFDELKVAEQDHQALVQENQLLNEDNQQLRQDNYALEEQIDELRDELDDKDFVSDDEVEQLEEAMSVGKTSGELKEFLDDAQVLGGINKDTLIGKLVTELKSKQDSLHKCEKNKGIPVTPDQLKGSELLAAGKRIAAESARTAAEKPVAAAASGASTAASDGATTPPSEAVAPPPTKAKSRQNATAAAAAMTSEVKVKINETPSH